MRVVVTGANGFLGSHLCRALLRDGHGVYALVRPNADLSRLRPLLSGLELIRLGADGRVVDMPWASCGALIHAATRYGRDDAALSDLLAANVAFPLYLAEQLWASAPGACFVNTDTFFSKPELGNQYLAGYTWTKRVLLSGLQCLATARTAVNVRLEHVYGPGDAATKFVASVLQRMLQGVPIPLSDGSQRRDFVFVEDVAQAYLEVLRRVPALTTGVTEVQVGRGAAMTVRAFVEQMKAVTGSASELHFGALPRRPGEVDASHADLSTLASWGWAPQWSPVEGLRRCVDALRTAPEP